MFLLQVYKLTAKKDPTSVWIALLGFLLATGGGLLFGFLLGGGEAWSLTIWTISGVVS